LKPVYASAPIVIAKGMRMVRFFGLALEIGSGNYAEIACDEFAAYLPAIPSTPIAVDVAQIVVGALTSFLQ
jgi:hypothetical protein